MEKKKIRFPSAAIVLVFTAIVMILRLRPIWLIFHPTHDNFFLDLIFNASWSETISFSYIAGIIAVVLLAAALCLKKLNLFLVIPFIIDCYLKLDVSISMFDVIDFRSHVIAYFLMATCDILLALLVLVCFFRDKSKKGFDKIATISLKFRYIPCLIYLIGVCIHVLPFFLLSIGGTITDVFQYADISDAIPYLPEILIALSYCLFASWLANPQKKERTPANSKQETCTSNADGYISLGRHIILSLFTFGIWPLIWIYRTTRFLNNTPNVEQYQPCNKLLLCMFIPFYQIYWYYKHGQRIDTYTKSKRMDTSDMATMCLILGIFVPFVASILMQDRINSICVAKEQVVDEAPTQDVSASITDELVKYKELLDMGVITQEEFDAKKKQLLGL